jgi:hypothetical protein
MWMALEIFSVLGLFILSLTSFAMKECIFPKIYLATATVFLHLKVIQTFRNIFSHIHIEQRIAIGATSNKCKTSQLSIVQWQLVELQNAMKN